MRSPLGSSIAAARTKASMAPLTRLAAAPLRMGSWLRTPLMSVKEAAVGDVIAPEEHQMDLAHQPVLRKHPAGRRHQGIELADAPE
jgi:hypothetical protein